MEYIRHRLPNGLVTLLIPMSGVHSATVTIFVGLGSRYELPRDAGVSHLIEHMLFKGTEKRPKAADISAALDGVGGVLNASTDKETTVYWAKVAGEHLPVALDVLPDMLLSSVLRPSDLARERRVVLEELAMLADDPQDWIHVITDEILWPGQALGREVAGDRTSVSRLRVADLRRYVSSYYGPNNAVVSIAGGIDVDQAAVQIEEAFSGWKLVPAPAPVPASNGPGVARSRVVYKPTEQVNLCLAFPGVPRRHPDRWAIELLCTILGGGTSSRLFLQLREKLALAYEVVAYTNEYADTGATLVYLGTDARKAEIALDAVFREINRLHRRRITEQELQAAQRYFRGRLWLGLEDTHAVAAWFGGQEILQHEVKLPDEVACAIDRVTTDDVMRVARSYLDPTEARLAAVGPVQEIGLERRLLGA
jgi:predicted Zn-dependent peptidase